MLLLSGKKLTPRLSPLSTALISRLLSTSTPDSPSPTSQFAVQYLINSCSLPSDEALRASRYISHLKSPQRPDAVLQFLRDAGVTQPHITAAARRGPSFLVYSVEKSLKPRMRELLELGFSPSQISLLFSLCPTAFSHSKLAQKIQFWMPILGSVEELLHTLKKSPFLITVNLQNSAIPNLSFLKEQCGLTLPQIRQLIQSSNDTITSPLEAMKIKVQRAEELGVSRSSSMFVYALITVCSLKQCNIDARLENLQSLGLSKEEVTTLVSKLPQVLWLSEEVIGRKIQFLTEEMGCHKLQLVTSPCLLTYSLEKRLIPRSRVKKLLELKELFVVKSSFVSLMVLTEKRFVEKFVLPYEHAIPGLHRAYVDACAGNIEGLKWFDRSLQV